jgi:hypothetical protein
VLVDLLLVHPHAVPTSEIDEPYTVRSWLDPGVSTGEFLVHEKEVTFGIPANDDVGLPELVSRDPVTVSDDQSPRHE